MTFDCIYCSKQFKKPNWISNHIKKKHHALLKLKAQETELERLRLRVLAHKITKLPVKINIPTEYIGVLDAVN